MYYCIVCSQLHKKRTVKDKIFKSGFYIDSFLGKQIHLGICDEEGSSESKQGKITQVTIGNV